MQQLIIDGSSGSKTAGGIDVTTVERVERSDAVDRSEASISKILHRDKLKRAKKVKWINVVVSTLQKIKWRRGTSRACASSFGSDEES